MRNRIIILLFITSLIFLGCTKTTNERPNIIIMMADDLGYGDVGYMGHQFIETPNIDSSLSPLVHYA